MENLPDFLRDMLAQAWVRALLVVIASLLFGKLADLFLCSLLARVARRTKTDLDDRLIVQLHRPIFLSVLLFGLFVAVRILDPGATTQRLLVASIQTVAIVVWSGGGLRIMSILLDGTNRLAGRTRWLDPRTVPLFDNVAKIVIIGGAIYCLLVAWNLNIAPWLASAGIVGIALRFAPKDSLANLFGGIFVIIDAPYKIGDYINLDSGERGRVVKIGLRSTRLLTRDDIEITVPNAAIANAKIVNESGGPYEKTRVTVVVGVAYGSDVDQVREVLLRAAQSVEQVLQDPAPRIRFKELGDSALIFRVLCWVEEPALRGQCIDGLNTAIYKGLGAAGITIPFPQRDVHLFQAPTTAV